MEHFHSPTQHRPNIPRDAPPKFILVSRTGEATVCPDPWEFATPHSGVAKTVGKRESLGTVPKVLRLPWTLHLRPYTRYPQMYLLLALRSDGHIIPP
jgi:hypothetical protein